MRPELFLAVILAFGILAITIILCVQIIKHIHYLATDFDWKQWYQQLTCTHDFEDVHRDGAISLERCKHCCKLESYGQSF